MLNVPLMSDEAATVLDQVETRLAAMKITDREDMAECSRLTNARRALRAALDQNDPGADG